MTFAMVNSAFSNQSYAEVKKFLLWLNILISYVFKSSSFSLPFSFASIWSSWTFYIFVFFCKDTQRKFCPAQHTFLNAFMSRVMHFSLVLQPVSYPSPQTRFKNTRSPKFLFSIPHLCFLSIFLFISILCCKKRRYFSTCFGLTSSGFAPRIAENHDD